MISTVEAPHPHALTHRDAHGGLARSHITVQQRPNFAQHLVTRYQLRIGVVRTAVTHCRGGKEVDTADGSFTFSRGYIVGDTVVELDVVEYDGFSFVV